jgi:hypothetical protein
VAKNEMEERIEEHNRRALHGDFNYEEKIRLRKLLDQDDNILALAKQLEEINDAMKVHERAKWIIRLVVYGTPILAALWQLLDRMHK